MRNKDVVYFYKNNTISSHIERIVCNKMVPNIFRRLGSDVFRLSLETGQDKPLNVVDIYLDRFDLYFFLYSVEVMEVNEYRNLHLSNNINSKERMMYKIFHDINKYILPNTIFLNKNIRLNADISITKLENKSIKISVELYYKIFFFKYKSEEIQPMDIILDEEETNNLIYELKRLVSI